MVNFLYVREILKITSLTKIFQKLGNKKKVSQLTQSLVLSFAASLNTSRAALWRARRKLKKNWNYQWKHLCFNKFKGQWFIYKLGFSPLMSILKFSHKKNSNVTQFVVLRSFLSCISCTPSIQTVRYVLHRLLLFGVLLCDFNYCCW